MSIPRRHLGPAVAWTASLVPLLLWFVATPDLEPAGRRAASHPIETGLGQLSGLTGMTMLAVAFVLSSRVRVLEGYFGGLDKMYREHHRLGVGALILICIHPLAHAFRFLPEELGRFFSFFAPLHAQMGVNYGVYAFWVFALLMVLTFYRRIPYDRWKISHKLLGVVLLLGAVHLLTVEPTRGRSVAAAVNPVLRYYVLASVALGLLAFLHKLIVVPLRSARNQYVVADVRRLNSEVLEVVLTPRNDPVDFEPGQFVFVTFAADGISREAHPFTVCSVPEDAHLSVTIKALGDFTTNLHRRLEAGARAKVEGPYGCFDYRDGGSRQIWLAGGVGIVPFLSWARQIGNAADDSRRIDLYYCVHSRGDAVHLEEFEELADRLEHFRIVLVCSTETGRLRAADVAELQGATIFMCGPKRFTSDLQRQFVQRGVARDRIHFEDFEFR